LLSVFCAFIKSTEDELAVGIDVELTIISLCVNDTLLSFTKIPVPDVKVSCLLFQ
jgi:hypothetical protein